MKWKKLWVRKQPVHIKQWFMQKMWTREIYCITVEKTELNVSQSIKEQLRLSRNRETAEWCWWKYKMILEVGKNS